MLVVVAPGAWWKEQSAAQPHEGRLRCVAATGGRRVIAKDNNPFKIPLWEYAPRPRAMRIPYSVFSILEQYSVFSSYWNASEFDTVQYARYMIGLADRRCGDGRASIPVPARQDPRTLRLFLYLET